MNNPKSHGQLLDEWLSKYPNYETVVFYHDNDHHPHVVVTHTQPSWDWQEVYTEDIDLGAEVAAKKKEVAALQAKVRSLESQKKALENAMATIAKFQEPPK